MSKKMSVGAKATLVEEFNHLFEMVRLRTYGSWSAAMRAAGVPHMNKYLPLIAILTNEGKTSRKYSPSAISVEPDFQMTMDYLDHLLRIRSKQIYHHVKKPHKIQKGRDFVGKLTFKQILDDLPKKMVYYNGTPVRGVLMNDLIEYGRKENLL